jgi:transcription-repair coupling factor (superfamily II helicase)
MKITEQQLRQVIKEEIEIEIDAQVTADDFIQISRRLNKLYRRLDDMDQQDEVMEIRKQLVALRKRVTGE